MVSLVVVPQGQAAESVLASNKVVPQSPLNNLLLLTSRNTFVDTCSADVIEVWDDVIALSSVDVEPESEVVEDFNCAQQRTAKKEARNSSQRHCTYKRLLLSGSAHELGTASSYFVAGCDLLTSPAFKWIMLPQEQL